MIGTTTRETKHGTLDYQVTLPAGIRVRLFHATNLPADSQIEYWARVIGSNCQLTGISLTNRVLHELTRIADSIGIGLQKDDVLISCDRFALEKLMAALQPFAELDIHHLKGTKDEQVIWQVNESQITVGNVRAAKRIMEMSVDEYDPAYRTREVLLPLGE